MPNTFVFIVTSLKWTDFVNSFSSVFTDERRKKVEYIVYRLRSNLLPHHLVICLMFNRCITVFITQNILHIV